MHRGSWGYQLPEDHERVERGAEVVQGDERDLQPQPQDQRVQGDGQHEQAVGQDMVDRIV